MKLLQTFRKLMPAPMTRLIDGMAIEWSINDRQNSFDVSRYLTPEHVDSILLSASVGETSRQCQLALEIEEKNWDIAQSVQTRKLAVAGLEIQVSPGDDSPMARKAAADFEAELKRRRNMSPLAVGDVEIYSLPEIISFELMGALLPGFSVTEIVWGNGGREIAGFNPIAQANFTFSRSRHPRLVQTDGTIAELQPYKFIYHRHRSRSGDATRGGLIRPLAWLHVFQSLAGVKDMLRFTERYGMPFVVAKVPQAATSADRRNLQNLIRNFGSDGGGIFGDGITLELLQAANSTGDVYFKLLGYCGDAITKVVLGQTASSGDGGGFSAGDAQSRVRSDLLRSDAAMVANTLTGQLAAPWTLFNYGSAVPPPVLSLPVDNPVDLKMESEVLMNLSNAGYQAPASEVSEKFGYSLSLKPAESPFPGQPATVAMSAESAKGPGNQQEIATAALEQFLAGSGMDEWFGPLKMAISEALAKSTDEESFRECLAKLLESIPQIAGKMDSAKFEEMIAKACATGLAGGIAAEAAALAGKGSARG